MAASTPSHVSSNAPIYSIGHSNRRIEEFIALLREAGIETLVDVRARPGSRRNPQFSEAALRASLDAAGIGYHWAGEQLGGLRSSHDESPHQALAGSGLQSYADYMESDVFARSVTELARMAGRGRIAMMCAERQPLDCHRSLIADWLVLHGTEVVHLVGLNENRAHTLRPEARRDSDRIVYDRNTQTKLL